MKVDLPQTQAKEIDPKESIVLSVAKDGGIFWQKEKISLQVLRERLVKRKASNRMQPVLLQGDKEAQYGTVIEVMDLLKELQIEQLGLILKPQQR
jgi:biopolymer transport protein ExbD